MARTFLVIAKSKRDPPKCNGPTENNGPSPPKVMDLAESKVKTKNTKTFTPKQQQRFMPICKQGSCVAHGSTIFRIEYLIHVATFLTKNSR